MSFLFAHLMHIRPWEIDLLTVDQFEQAAADCEAYVREQNRAAREA